MAGCREKSTMKHSDIMAALAESNKLAKDTLNRVKSRMPVTFEEQYGANDKNVQFSANSKSEKSDNLSKSKCSSKSQSESKNIDKKCHCCGMKKKKKSPKETRPKKDLPVVPLESGAKGDRTMAMVAYYMDRISHQCETHFASLPSSALTEDDVRHVQRFHKSDPDPDPDPKLEAIKVVSAGRRKHCKWEKLKKAHEETQFGPTTKKMKTSQGYEHAIVSQDLLNLQIPNIVAALEKYLKK